MVGQTISHYKIIEKLGEGGMGVVYKAQDLTLDRLVALKFLPSHLSEAEKDNDRFVQEAKAAAALNHPNICTIYGIEEVDGPSASPLDPSASSGLGVKLHFIVMEFVDGKMLEEVKSTLSQKQAIEYGIQIAEGLAVAHERGIVHRDIKPENIMIRKDGIVQVMDFGLAKLRGVSRLTKEGSTVGTAGYMSPEQVQGHEVDHRSDIFSLGVLLFEMLTGQLPFKGMHETAMSYEIVNVDSPPPSSIRPEIPPELDAIVLECLEKDPKERTQSAGQVAVDLKRYRRESSRQRASRITAARPAIASTAAGPISERTIQDPAALRSIGFLRRFFPHIVIGFATGLLGALAAILSRPEILVVGPISSSIEMPRGVEYVSGVGGHSAISPDGTMIVFSAIDSQFQRALWVRPLRSPNAVLLTGTKDAEYPFWSHDSRSIGFFANGSLRIISAGGGPVLTLAEAQLGRGGAWSPSGTIIFSPNVSDPNLYAVAATGGAVRQVTSFDSTDGTAPRFPSFLPGGRKFVFTSVQLAGLGTKTITYVGSLDSDAPTEIARDWSNAVYASGYLLYLRQGILMAQPFDPSSATLTGDAISLQEGVNAWGPRAKGDFSASENGLLLTSIGGSQTQDELVWIGPEGRTQPILRSTTWQGARLSPDGSRVAYDEVEGQSQRVDIWVYELARNVKTRLTFGSYSSTRPVWSRDGSFIYFSSEIGASKANILVKRSDGTGKELVVIKGPDPNATLRPLDVSPDGRTLLAVSILGNTGVVGMIDVSQPGRPAEFQPLGFRAESGRFSPDGRWIVYQSDESGKREVYVRSSHGADGQWQISSGTGEEAIWTASDIIYYSSAIDTYMRVQVTYTGGRPSFSQAHPLFPPNSDRLRALFDVAKSGRRFLGVQPIARNSHRSLSLVSNWPQLLER